MKCKIELEMDLDWPSGVGLTDEEIQTIVKTTVIDSVLKPARANAQKRRRELMGNIKENAEEIDKYDERIQLIDQAIGSVKVEPYDWREAFTWV